LNTTLLDDKALTAVIERVEEMYTLADRYAFPAGEHHTPLESTFSSTEILWSRKDADDDALEEERQEDE
jgi:hypothetical protein